MNLKVELVKRERVPPFINLEGEIDVYTSPKLKEKILELIDGGEVSFVVNLERVTYIDSTGLGVLIGALKRTREKRGSLYLIYSNPRLKRIFEITGLDKNFSIYNNEKELLEHLKKEGS
ncbi:MAG: anti-sigma B factor antagonist [Armatimonadetes bacterium CG07_land_8_20_14_0_80_40_9]|nr:MAG: anti-sigma B factor antagonist [Armatimonadetes bacterium CG07_land_8_20_14_0_80_40_9]